MSYIVHAINTMYQEDKYNKIHRVSNFKQGCGRIIT